MAGVQIKNHLSDYLKSKIQNANPVLYIKGFIKSKFNMKNVHVERKVKFDNKIQIYSPQLSVLLKYLMY